MAGTHDIRADIVGAITGRGMSLPAALRDGAPIVLPSLGEREVVSARLEITAVAAANVVRAVRNRIQHSNLEAAPERGFHQVLAAITPFDAVSNDALAIHGLLAAAGIPSRLFAEHVDARYRDRVATLDRIAEVDGEPVLYHVSAHSPRAVRALQRRSGEVLLRYHNITPSHWFDGVSAGHQLATRGVRRDLVRLARLADAAVADSAFNGEELIALGMRDVEVIPILLADASSPPRWSGGGGYAIAVGRIAPNKRVDFLLRAVAAYQEAHDPVFGLVLVGSDRGLERYGAACRELERELGVRNVRWVGSVDEAEKLRLMAEADAYLCASDHEGFCVPIVESFRLGLPVVARATTAVTGTCGDALAVDTDDPSYLADVMRVVVIDADLRARLIAVQDEEVKRFDPEVVGAQFLDWARRHVAAAR